MDDNTSMGKCYEALHGFASAAGKEIAGPIAGGPDHMGYSEHTTLAVFHEDFHNFVSVLSRELSGLVVYILGHMGDSGEYKDAVVELSAAIPLQVLARIESPADLVHLRSLAGYLLVEKEQRSLLEQLSDARAAVLYIVDVQVGEN